MPRYIGATNTAAITAGANFTAGNQSKGSLYDFLKSMGGEKGSAPAAFSLMDVYTQVKANNWSCLLYTSPSPRDRQKSRMPSSA